MDVDETGIERTHEGVTLEVSKFRCSDCDKVGFRGTEAFESSRYKSTSAAYQWGALKEDDLYDSPPWIAPDEFALVVDYGNGETEEFRMYEDEDEALRAKQDLKGTLGEHGVTLRVEGR